jgi:hypothetical protein
LKTLHTFPGEGVGVGAGHGNDMEVGLVTQAAV